MSDLSFAEVGEILQLLQGIDGADVELEWGDLKIHVRRGVGADAAQDVPVAAVRANTGLGVDPDQQSSPVDPAMSAGTPTADSAHEVADEPGPAADIPPHWVPVAAPMVGTFYRAPKPEDPPFVDVGDTVTAGDTVALVEVMKLFTELKAEVAGKVARVDAADSSLVEFNQPLIWIEPA
ncbi:MAG TPA: biotin/lipoyl-containing protein [Nocardioidaceae bacterium]|nr:biotin/lipoyl-containing protein [Nocardioidaceae bacterium]